MPASRRSQGRTASSSLQRRRETERSGAAAAARRGRGVCPLLLPPLCEGVFPVSHEPIPIHSLFHTERAYLARAWLDKRPVLNKFIRVYYPLCTHNIYTVRFAGDRGRYGGPGAMQETAAALCVSAVAVARDGGRIRSSIRPRFPALATWSVFSCCSYSVHACAAAACILRGDN